jgi:hypothetical protein
MVTSTRVSGVTTRPMEGVSTHMLMGPSTMESGKTISSMGEELKRGLMALSTRANTVMERRMERGNWYLRTRQCTMESSR